MTESFPLTQDVIDNHQEQAAIMEFDAGMARADAEAAACNDMMKGQDDEQKAES